MQSDNGRLNFGARIDNSQLRTDAQESKDILKSIGTTAKEEGDAIDETFNKIGKAAAGVFAVATVKDFVTQVANVRGEFQQLELAFSTMLGSAEEADKLMSQLIKTAATTPFGMSDIANSAKQLLAYGVEADKINDTLIRLGDIAAGLSIPINDLAYLYGTTMVQGRMYTQDLNQFLGRGIPLTEELAKQFGVSTAKVKELVTEGKVGFPEVEKAIISMTSEGSKFGGLMSAQSQTITGQISNIEDSIEQMFNEIGKQSEGVINDTLDIVSKLVDNWQTVGKVLLVVISTYGAYKAAVLAVAAAHKIAAIWGEVQAFLSLTRSVTSAKDAMLLLNIATKANPIGLILGVVAAAASAFLLFRDNSDAATEAAKRQKEELQEFNKQVGDATGQSISAYKQLQAEYKNCKDAHSKREWIKESQRKFKDLGISVTDVNTAENVFVKNTQVMMDAFKKRAEAAAWQTKLNEEYSKRVQRQMELEEERAKISEGAEVKGSSHNVKNGEYIAPDNKWRYTAEGAAKALKEFDDNIKNDAVLNQIDENINNYANKVATIQQDFDSALKKAGTASGTSSSSKKKGKNEAQRLADAAAQRNSEIAKYDKELKEQRSQAMLDIRQETINSMKEGTDKEIAQNELNYDRLMAENDKREKEMLSALAEQKVLEWQQKNPKATKAQEVKYRDSLNLSKSDLTAAQQETLAAYEKIAQEIRDKGMAKLEEERRASERASMQSYLQEYGDYQEKRLALTQEAEDKIAKIKENGSLSDTDKDYQTKSIQKGLEKSLKDLDFEKLKKDINWDFIFGDLENTAPEAVAAVKEQLQQFFDTAKDLTPDQIKTVTEALEKLQDRMDLSAPIKTIKAARKEYAAAKKEYDQYNKAYQKAKASGDTKAMTDASNGMVKSSQQMTKAANKEKKSYNEVIDCVDQYAKALEEAGDTMGGTAGEMVKMAASAITCGTSMAKGIDQFKNAVSNMEKAIAILAIIEAALKAIQLIASIFGDTADETLTDYVETMKLYIDLLSDSISDLSESMSAATNSMEDTIAYYKQLVALEKESATAIKSESQVWLNSGASKGFLGIGSKSSEGVKISKQIGKDLKSGNEEVRKFYQEGYAALNEYFYKATGRYAQAASDFGRMDFIWTLSDEDLIKLSEDTKAMALLGDTLSEAVANYAEKIQAVKEDELDLAESLLSVSWDDFYDDFVDLIKDMDKTSEDFANSFAEYMRNALVKNLVADKYKESLQKLYERAADWAKQGLLEDHIDELRQEYQTYAENAQKETEVIDKITGYQNESSREASSSGIASASQDSVDELNGRMTAIQGHTYNLNENTKLLVQNSNLILRSVQNIDRNTEDIPDRLSSMESNIKSVKDTVNDIALKGIKIKA